MIKIATVRKTPKTGLGKAKRQATTLIYLNGHKGQRVVVLEYREYRELMFRAKATKLRNQILKLTKRLERIRGIAL